jgi:hypothetical protein
MKLIDEQALAALDDVREQLAHFQLSEAAGCALGLSRRGIGVARIVEGTCVFR